VTVAVPVVALAAVLILSATVTRVVSVTVAVLLRSLLRVLVLVVLGRGQCGRCCR
jgi:hypothetical protein